MPTPAGPFYALATMTLPLSLVDQFGAVYDLCDSSVWAAESPGVTVSLTSASGTVSGPAGCASAALNLTATLVCLEGGSGLALIVRAGSEARTGSFALGVAVGQTHVGGSPMPLYVAYGPLRMRDAGRTCRQMAYPRTCSWRVRFWNSLASTLSRHCVTHADVQTGGTCAINAHCTALGDQSARCVGLPPSRGCNCTRWYGGPHCTRRP